MINLTPDPHHVSRTNPEQIRYNTHKAESACSVNLVSGASAVTPDVPVVRRPFLVL